MPDSLRVAENRQVLAFLEGGSAHSDVVETLLEAARPLGDVQAYCPDVAAYGYVLLVTQNRVFAYAAGMDRIGCRLDAMFRRRALETGGGHAPGLGGDWVDFQLFRTNYPAVDLTFWMRKAYLVARGCDPT